MRNLSYSVFLMFLVSSIWLFVGCSSTSTSKTIEPSWAMVYEREIEHSVFFAGFFDAEFGITVGYGGATYYTLDGGENWVKSVNEANCRFGLDLLNRDYLWTIGNYGGNRISINGGASLFAVTDLPLIEERPNSQVSIINEKDIWVASPLCLAHTQDAGLTWSVVELPDACEEIAGLYFYTGLGGYLLDRNGTLYETSDGAQSWTVSGMIPTVEGIRQTKVPSVAMHIDEDGNGLLVYLDKNGLLYSFALNLGASDAENSFTTIAIPEIKNSFPYLSKDGKWLTVTSIVGNIKVFQLVQ